MPWLKGRTKLKGKAGGWECNFSVMLLDWNVSDTDLDVIRGLGVKNTYIWLPHDHHTFEELKAMKERIESHDLVLHNVLSGRCAKNPKIHLAEEGRDEAIEEFKLFLHWLQALGIKNTVFTWEPDALYHVVWTTAREKDRGCDTRCVDAEKLKDIPYTHNREYTRDELWQNFTYFMQRIIPECEKTGVRLALHPNDPPVDFPIAGVPCLIRNVNDYRRAFKIADSFQTIAAGKGKPKMLGMEFCCGCWLEGGEKGFGNLIDGMREFLIDERIIIVHFRNVSNTLPVFSETFLDDGYADMYPIMKTLQEHDYRGTVTLDHTPALADGPRLYSATAYAIGYMRALQERADAETAAEGKEKK